MKLKKILAVLCFCALAVSLAVPVFAAPGDPIENGASIDYEGAFPDEDLTVAVSVLYAMKKLYVNPYGLPYTIQKTSLMDNSGQTTGEKIQEGTVTDGWFSNTAVIKNNSTTSLGVSVTISTDAHGAAKVVDDADDAALNPQFNCLYGDFQITKATLVSGVITPTDWDTNMKTVAIPSTDNPIAAAQPTGFTLDGAQEGTGMQAGTTIPAYAAFRIRGHAVICSADATGSDATAGSTANVWPEDDVVDMTVAFSFT